MKTNTKSKTKVNNWVLKNKETGKVYSNWSYPSRNAARKAAKGKRFKGMYTATRAGDGGIDPKKLKKGKPAPAPKSELGFTEANLEALLNLIFDNVEVIDEPEQEEFNYNQPYVSIPVPHTVTKESIDKGMSTRKLNTKPQLRSRNSTPGAKFHKHKTFGAR